METLLKKYYEYFLKGNFQDKKNIHDKSEFFKFYQIIINLHDISNNEKILNDIEVFKEFYEPFGKYKNECFYSEKHINQMKEEFEQTEDVTFDWFVSSPYLETDYYNKDFIYTQPNRINHWSKVYMSIKPEHYIKTIIKLQDFINYLANKYGKYNIGQCKFRKEDIANDSIVLRFSCKEHYEDFKHFLDNNPEIYEAFDTPNPFLPTDDHNLSIITDCGGSYNYFVARMIWDYMFECREKQENPNVKNLINFIIDYDTSKDPMLYDDDKQIIEDFKYVLISKLENINDLEIINTIFREKENNYVYQKRS